MAAKQAAGLSALDEEELRIVGDVDSGPCQTKQTGVGDVPERIQEFPATDSVTVHT